jgi:inner membrane protein
MLQPVWIWAILGLILLGMEMLSATFYILWFGIAALCVALMLYLYPAAPIALQLLVFSMMSLVSLGLWRWKYKSVTPLLRVGQSHDDSIGKTGRMITPVSPEQNGRIAFTVPVMSSREWAVVADESIGAGEQADVVGIEGNYLRVRRAAQAKSS